MSELTSAKSACLPFSEEEIPPLVRALLLRPGVSISCRDERWRLQRCNANYAKQFGMKPSDMVGSTLADAMGATLADFRLAVVQPELWKHGEYSCIQVWSGMRVTMHMWNRNLAKGGRHPTIAIFDPRPIADAELDAGLPTLLEPFWGRFNKLSRRELEVLYLTSMGYNADEAAKMLCRAEKTVENHVASIYDKLGIHTKAEITRIAVEHGILAFTQEQWFAIAARYPRESRMVNETHAA